MAETTETAREQFEKWAAQRGLDKFYGRGSQLDWRVDRERAQNIWNAAWQAALSTQPQPTREALEGAAPMTELNPHIHLLSKLTNARAMADNLMKCPANEQCLAQMQSFAAQAIRDLSSVCEDLIAEICSLRDKPEGQ